MSGASIPTDEPSNGYFFGRYEFGRPNISNKITAPTKNADFVNLGIPKGYIHQQNKKEINFFHGFLNESKDNKIDLASKSKIYMLN